MWITMKWSKRLVLLTLWDEEIGPTIYDANRSITPEIQAITIQCFMPCLHLFSSGLNRQSGKPPMKLTLPLPHFEKVARIYFSSWEDKMVRGQYRAFGIFFISNEISPLEELFYDAVITRLEISEELFRKNLMSILAESLNPRNSSSFDVDAELNAIKERLITSSDLIKLYNGKELRLICQKLGIPIHQKSKKKIANNILISLLGLNVK
jgi:hypothetical protein